MQGVGSVTDQWFLYLFFAPLSIEVAISRIPPPRHISPAPAHLNPHDRGVAGPYPRAS